MFRPFAHSSHMPCPDCGASVAASELDEHVCNAERRLDYELFLLRAEIGAFDDELTAYLESPRGRFAQWLAERGRR